MPKRNLSQSEIHIITQSQSDMPAAKKSKSAPTKTTFVVKAKKPSKSSKFYDPKSKSLPQVKQLDWTPNAALNTTGTINNLVSCAQGTGEAQRVGQKIQVISVEYDIQVAVATTDLANVASYPTNSNAVKLILVYDKQPNGATATWGNVMQATGATAAFEYRNIDYFDRFDILAMERIELDSTSQNSARVHRFVPMSKEVRYNGGNTGTITDVMTGNLMLMATDENGSGLRSTVWYGKVRVRYIDN